MSNSFFKNNGPFKIDKLLALSNIPNKHNIKKLEVVDIKDLLTAKNNEITFFHSKKYAHLASKSKALFCITTNNLSKILPNKCNKIIVENVLIATAMITKIFYPNSVTDDFDSNVNEINDTNLANKLFNIIDNKEEYLDKKINMKNFSYQNTWNNINQKIKSIINEN